jgi:hypothetical protein
MEVTFSGPVWFWRGPAPWYFVTVPEDESNAIQDTAERTSYGWGMVPVVATIGGTEFTTSMWRKDDRYVVPVKAPVRRAEDIDEDDVVTVHLVIDD